MKNRTNFTHRLDMWDDTGENIIEHLAGVEDYEIAEATYRAAAKRWPKAVITLRQGCASDPRQSADRMTRSSNWQPRAPQSP
jgi:hypothetical protein